LRIKSDFIIALALAVASCVQPQGSVDRVQLDPPPAAPEQNQNQDQGNWPREIKVEEGVVIIYQPQPDKLVGNLVSGRMAVSVELTGSDKPAFGAVWFDARLQTDRDTRTGSIDNLDITQLRFTDSNQEKADKLSKLLETQIPKWNLPIDMDRLLTTLERAEKRSQEAENISTSPPNIVFMPEPAVLVSIDGEPRLQQENDSNLKRVINTPFTLLFDPDNKRYYLYADTDTWYSANEIKGEWKLTDSVPVEVAARAPETKPGSEIEDPDAQAQTGPPPGIIVATEPTELISSQAKAEFAPIENTSLLYMSNTDSDVFMDINTQQYYLLLAGRWYAGKTMEGPWNHVAGAELPGDFAKIPKDSEMSTVLYAVPGTEEAKEAVLDAQIPQTAAIERAAASLTVKYDGLPDFQPIQGTSLHYAINTATPVIRAASKYYAVDQGVWFESDQTTGPWRVATSIPDEIYTIPADSPLYNVTFVHVYSATPEVVYVGYTPGYTHTYIYHDTIVYGSGYWWPGWYSQYYYPYPTTWGYHVRWSPWRGWGFGFSYGNSPYRFTVGYSRWWGPRRYYGYQSGYRHGYRDARSAGYRSAYRTGQNLATRQNLYKSERNQQRLATVQSRPQASATGLSTGGKVAIGAAAIGGAAAISNNRSNNVYTNSSGDIYRKTEQGWQQRSNRDWKGAESSTQQLNRSYQARERGAQRANSYRQSGARPSGARRSSGRGGGGRRR